MAVPLVVALLSPRTAQAQVVTTFAGSGLQGSANGTGTAASFYHPAGVTVDSSGNVYVADTTNNKIRKITPEGVVTTLAGSGAGGSVDGPGPTASFAIPTGVAVDLSGSVYVADWGNNKIRKITPGGVVTTLAGSGAGGSADGPGPTASFYAPAGVAVDLVGNVYVGDYDNFKIRKITPAGDVSTFAGSGAPGSADGAGSSATFSAVWGVAVDSGGSVYVADMGNQKIRKITPAGDVTTLGGSGAVGSVDGPGPTASFFNPTGVAVDSSGNVYVADMVNHKIRKITPAGDVSTFAGTGVLGDVDCLCGKLATFRFPYGVAVDVTGNVYVADTNNNRIRKITLPQGGEGCVEDTFTACLVGRRYSVTGRWQNQYEGGQLRALPSTCLTDATAAFWSNDVSTLEYLIRINTATDNGRAWISISTFTDVEFWIDVTDMASGQHAEYHSPAGNRTLIYDPYYFVFP